MRICLLIIQFPPDVNSTGLLMADIGAGLVAKGHDVSVITTFPHYEKFRVWEEFRGKVSQRRPFRGMLVQRLWVYAPGTKSMRHRLLSYLSFNALATAAGLLSRRSYDVVLCTNGSFFTGITASMLLHFRTEPFIYNVQDLYPEVPVATGQLRSKHAIAALERMERFMYRRAAHVTVIAPSFQESLLAKGVQPDKVSIIPNFVDTDFIRPLPRNNAFSTEFGLDGKFVVSHAGNLGLVYDLETLLDAAALVAAEKAITFVVVGDGVARPALEQKARQLDLENVRFLPFQPREKLPWLRATSDVQVSLYRRGSAKYSMPSKVYEIMASGRPLLASADPGSDVWNLIESTGCGVCVEPGNAGQLADVVMQMYRDPAWREQLGGRGREHAVAHYSARAAVESYHNLISRVASSGIPRTEASRAVVVK